LNWRKISITCIQTIYIFSFIGNVLSATILVFSGILPAVISNTNPSELNIYPNYILVYVHHLVIPELACLVAFIIYFSHNFHLKNTFKKQFKSVIDLGQNLYLGMKQLKCKNKDSDISIQQYDISWSYLKVVTFKVLTIFKIDFCNVILCFRSIQ